MSFNPSCRMTQSILDYLHKIENVKESFKNSNISPVFMASLKNSIKIASIHYSTKIEGNRLTLKEVEEAVFKRKIIENRQRDSFEVNAYYKAMNYIEKCLKDDMPLSEKRKTSCKPMDRSATSWRKMTGEKMQPEDC